MKANQTLNHSAAHLLAAAVLKLYPDTKIGIGPAIEEGFYYDFKFTNPITDQDLLKIEKQMKKIVSGGHKFLLSHQSKLLNQPYKEELLKEIKARNQKDTYYELINPSNQESIFTDLCAGPHVDSVSQIKHFKLLSLAGAYWRGDSKNDQLTRIYGTAWESKEELEKYLNLLKERKERDHRKIGKDMNIFTFNQMAGQGFPIWLEDGMIIKNTIQSYIRKTEKNYGFKEYQTPAFGSVDLYKKSGHWDHYQENMFPIIEVENEKLVMRPMTCPHHILLYSSQRRSYRELPLRISEQARLYRYESSGSLTGLERVRSMELTEGHVFCRPDQIFEEFKNSYSLIQEVLKKFKIEIDYVSLSLRDKEDKEKYFDDDKMWKDAENELRKVLNELKIDYKEEIGEAAFYGPKVDIQVKSALGHEITLSTLQLDFLLPKRFDAYYLDKDENKITPILIHRGLIGTYERFIAILLEQTKGDLPFWYAPRQATVIPVVEEKHLKYAEKITKKLNDFGLNVYLNNKKERVGKKIREAQLSKTKYQIVVGDDEVNNETITIRKYGSEKTSQLKVEEFLTNIKELLR